LQKVEELPAAYPTRAIATSQGGELLAHLRSGANKAVATSEIELYGVRVVRHRSRTASRRSGPGAPDRASGG